MKTRTSSRTPAPKVAGSLVLPIIAVLIFALPLSPSMVENAYSNNVYHWWQSWTTGLSNLAPFAVLDVFILGLAALVIWRGARLVGAMRTQGVVATVVETFLRVLRAVSVVALLFLVFWGLNYRRVPLEDRVQRVTPSVDDLKGVIADADALGARLRPSAYDYPAFVDVTRLLQQPLNEALEKCKRAPLETA